MRFSFLKNAMISFFAILVFVVGAVAQTGNTSLRGTIADPNGASVPDAVVKITNPDVGRWLSVSGSEARNVRAHGFRQRLCELQANWAATASGHADNQRRENAAGKRRDHGGSGYDEPSD